MSKFFDPTDKNNKPILDYFEQRTWLIIHSSSIVRSTLKKTLNQLGTKAANIFDATTMDDAQKTIEGKKPHYVIANKTINDLSTTPLFDIHMKAMPNRIQGGFFVVTEEVALSEVAWALEYEMDGIVVLPLNGTSMFKTFLTAVERKVTPTPYLLKIEEGRERYLRGDFDSALAMFRAALVLDQTPFESCAFIGQIYHNKKLIPEAISSFEESITHNTQYFKSLKRLSELYYQERNYKKAYDVNLLMAQNYPTPPERIPELIRLSIINQKYEDITNYFKIFQTINNPSLQIQNYLSAGLAILGKYFISCNDTQKAVEALETAFKYANGKYEILKNISQSFQEMKKSKILFEMFAKTELERWPKDIQGLYFYNLHLSSKEDQKVIQTGEALLQNNVIDILIYRGLIERSIKMKRKIGYIENIILEASRSFPENADEFEGMLKKSLI